jgi:hypothetical protein
MFVRGYWCYTYCTARRRLTLADEQARPERLLVSEEELQQAATECYVHKIQEGYECLGNPEDLRIQYPSLRMKWSLHNLNEMANG